MLMELHIVIVTDFSMLCYTFGDGLQLKSKEGQLKLKECLSQLLIAVTIQSSWQLLLLGCGFQCPKLKKCPEK